MVIPKDSTATAKTPSCAKTVGSTTAAVSLAPASQQLSATPSKLPPRANTTSSARAAVSTTASTTAKGANDRSLSRGRATRQSSESLSPSRKRAKQDVVTPSRASPRTRSASAGKPAPAAVPATTPSAAAHRARSTSTGQPTNQIDQADQDAPGPSTGATTRTIKQERKATAHRQKAATLKESADIAREQLKPAVGRNVRKVNKCTNTNPNHKHSRACGGAAVVKPEPAFKVVEKKSSKKSSEKKSTVSLTKKKLDNAKYMTEKKRKEKMKEKKKKAREARKAKKMEKEKKKREDEKEKEERAKKAKNDEEDKEQTKMTLRSDKVTQDEEKKEDKEDKSTKMRTRSFKNEEEEEEKMDTSDEVDEETSEDSEDEKKKRRSKRLTDQQKKEVYKWRKRNPPPKKEEEEPLPSFPETRKRRATTQLDPAVPEKEASTECGRSADDSTMAANDRTSNSPSPARTRSGGRMHSPKNRPDPTDKRKRASERFVDSVTNTVVLLSNAHVTRNNEVNPPSALPRSSQDRNQRDAQNRSVRQVLPLAQAAITNRNKMNRAQAVVDDVVQQAVAQIKERREKEKSSEVDDAEKGSVIDYSKEQAVAANVLKTMSAKEARSYKDDLREWDGSEKQLAMLRKRVRSEGVLLDPYTKEIEQKFATQLRRELKTKEIPAVSGLFQRFFWMVRYAADDIGHHTHMTLEESSAFAEKKSKDAKWTFKEVLATLRLIEIKSICEACRNPLWLSKEQLAKVNCTCPKSKTPEWKAIKLRKYERHNKKAKKDKRVSYEEYVKTTLKRIYVAEADKLAEKYKHLQKAQIVEELFDGKEKAFLEEYPLWEKPLKERTDPIGRQTYDKQLELYRVRCEANQCPTFIFEWTGKTRDLSGGIGMPHQWITDQGTSLSADAQAEFNKKMKSPLPKIDRCKGNCSGRHSCCTQWTTSYTIGPDGLARTKDGKFLGGVDGRKVPRQCWEYEASMQLCDETCGCDDLCIKRFLKHGPQKMIIIFKTHTHGWSVRAAEDIERSEYIGTFSGHIMTQKDLETTNQDSEMYFTITPQGGWKKGEDPLYTLTTCLWSNELKYVNHSCVPNSLIIRTYSRKTGDLLHGIALFARQKILAFHEITYDYFKRSDTIPFTCLCGGYACRGAAVEEKPVAKN